ncbi:TolC family protein [Polynucleobacter yangtzensis]|jgi:outer membrane protein TolC|uniref:TolC family protein n=1 Tax=Polynucleobacter yangtzensis TaxID=1743159 RepID=UPI00082D5B7E|nr:TolC family protein [Polynucleobacter yangtzensis]
MFREKMPLWRNFSVWMLCIPSIFWSIFAYADDVKLNKNELKSLYEIAWERQPESKSYQFRVDAALAKQKIASSFLASPASIEIAQKTDRANSNQGASETIAGLGIPLWLWGERANSIGLADAEYKRLLSQYLLIQLKVAAEVRDAYWSYKRSNVELDLANGRFQNAKALSFDVEKRFRAGDLSRADLHQANGALANAEASLAEAQANFINAEQKVRSLLGVGMVEKSIKTGLLNQLAEPIPKVPDNLSSLDFNLPVVAALLDQLEVAKKAVSLAKAQTRSTPELQLLTTRGRDVYGVPFQQSITLGIRIPFGSDSRYQNKLATTTAEMVEAESQLALERERTLSNIESSVLLVKTARLKADSSEKRAVLANETRSFFEKSFRFGETDLPTRLRIELEASDASRQAAVAKINYAVAISNLRQALGLLPE